MSVSSSRPPAPPKPPSADDAGFKRELVALIPHLRAFARTLTGDATAADDLAQDAM
jgi:RNA polymerase sigma-70 factor (ECF subfamily)